MTRNYNLGSRNMVDAASIALNKMVRKKVISYSTADSLTAKFRRFSEFAKNSQVGRMERITPELVKEYGRILAFQVLDEECDAGYAQNLISAINSVLTYASGGQWTMVSPINDCGIQKRCTIREEPTIEVELAHEAISYLRNINKDSAAYVAELALYFGLRAKEASLLNAKLSFKGACLNGFFDLKKGTKGGRPRTIPIHSEHQLQVLKRTSDFQGNNRSVMPATKNWKQWVYGGLRSGRENLHKFNIRGYHELRASYAAERYLDLTDTLAPVNGGKIIDLKLDRDARLTIANELGHARIDVVGAYIGGRR